MFDYDWSPDGKWLVYARQDGRSPASCTSSPRPAATPQNITRYATFNGGVTLEPDGKKLAFISQRRQDLDVFVLSLQKPPREGETASDANIDSTTSISAWTAPRP